MSAQSTLAKAIYWTAVKAGCPFGGIRPRRITNWLASRAYGDHAPGPEEFRWYRDRYGVEFLLHPYYYLDQNIIANGCYESKTNNFISRRVKKDMICIDVGSNMGTMCLHMAKRVTETGEVHAFEPVPHLHDRLMKNLHRNGLGHIVRSYRCALSDHSGIGRMSVASVTEPNQGMGSTVSLGCAKLAASIEVRITTLDDFVLEQRIARLDFVKVDIQGAEPLFLRGGSRTLARWKPLMLIEVSPDDLKSLGVTNRDLLDKIEFLGYKIFELDRLGEPGKQIRSSDIPANYRNSAVLCTP